MNGFLADDATNDGSLELESTWQEKLEGIGDSLKEFVYWIAEHKFISIPAIFGLAEFGTWLGLHFAGGAEITSNMIPKLSTWIGHTLNFSLISALVATVAVPAIIKAVIKHQHAKKSSLMPLGDYSQMPGSSYWIHDEKSQNVGLNQNGAEPSQDGDEPDQNDQSV
jgi:hypothetical protein